MQAHDSVTELKMVSENLASHHPYVIALLITFAAREIALHTHHDSWMRTLAFDYCGLHKNNWFYKACALGLLLDVVTNQENSLPGQCVATLYAIVKTYSTSTNSEFLKKGINWFKTVKNYSLYFF